MSKQRAPASAPAPTASAVGPCPTIIKSVGRPGTGSLPSTIAPPDHPNSHTDKHTDKHIKLLYGTVFSLFLFYCLKKTERQYSRLSLSRLRLSRTTAYLEEKIWSMFKSNIR